MGARRPLPRGLYARINLWSFELPGLAERREDIEPNLEFELARHAAQSGRRARFNAEARRAYLAFAAAPQARKFPRAVGIGDADGDAGRRRPHRRGRRGREIARLRHGWQDSMPEQTPALLDTERLARLDLFDRMQLEGVLRVCAESATLSEAGRKLFAASRQLKAQPNDADRLRKYLARFGLDWEQTQHRDLG